MPVFDSHLHIIDPAHPLVENNGFVPEPFTVADYLERTRGLGIAGGAVVSGSFQGFDQGYLIDALQALGPGFVGVTQIPPDTSDERILELHLAGIRAVRFNVARGGSADLDDLERLAGASTTSRGGTRSSTSTRARSIRTLPAGSRPCPRSASTT